MKKETIRKELYNQILQKQSEAVDFDFPIEIQSNHIVIDIIKIEPIEKTESGLYLPQQSLEGLKITNKGFGKDKFFKDSGTQMRKEEEVVKFDTHPFQGIVVLSTQIKSDPESPVVGVLTNKDIEYKRGDYVYLKPKWGGYSEPLQIGEKIYFVCYPELILGLVDLTKIKVEE